MAVKFLHAYSSDPLSSGNPREALHRLILGGVALLVLAVFASIVLFVSGQVSGNSLIYAHLGLLLISVTGLSTLSYLFIRLSHSGKDAADEALINKYRLEDTRKRMEGILDTAVEAIITIDEKGLVQSINKSAQSLFLVDQEEMLGQNIKRLMPSKIANEHDSYLVRHLESSEQRAVGLGREIIARKTDGIEFPAFLSISRLDLEGEVLFTGIIRDMTLDMTARAAEVNSAKTLASFAHAAAHDLKAPLRHVNQLMGFVQEDLGEEIAPQITQQIERVYSQTAAMSELISSLLEFAEAGNKKPKLSEVELDAVLKQVLENLATDIEEKNATVSVVKLPRVHCDPTLLTNVFQNLIANALKFTAKSERPHIEIFANTEPGFCTLSIKDNGIGIETEKLDYIFDSFTRLHSSASYSGSGIGLSTCKHIIEAHSGAIWANSDGPGTGTTIQFWLPND